MAVLHGWRYCPRCAGPLELDEGRAHCPACGSTYYANSAPAASALVLDERGRVLLARRAHDPDADKWDTPGGFLEEGEEPLDALRRELLEETGLDIEPGRFVTAYADRYGDGPRAQATLNLLWEARVIRGEPRPDDDVSELRWFDPSELPPDNEIAFTALPDVLREWARERR